ncbi:hypothetical protein ES703_79788 [subsurface metagenome]
MGVLPPEDPPVSSILYLTAAEDGVMAGAVTLSWTELGTGLATDFWDIQIAGPFQSQGRKSVTARYAMITTVAGNILEKQLAGLDEGFWYWFRVRYVDEFGQVTAWHSGQATPKLTV